METDRENTGKCRSEQQQQRQEQRRRQQQQTLDFMVNLGNKQDDRESDGAMLDETPPSPPPPPPGDDVAPDAVDDEGVDVIRDPDYAEERFRVDRRKLEQLIQASEDEEENAEEFFKKIMSETNTHVAWPSKLKIGAKSKKDPHIKVSGHKDSVAEAKNRILAVLDTKSLRMTLKMDVSHTEHSHVIGKSGHNIKRVMQETGCHIHFPDSNRNTLAEKSNQVSVAGLCEGVELARGRIRELLPLVFMFEVPMTGLNQSNVDSNSAVIQSLQHHYGVNINIKTHHQIFTKTVIVRGSVYNSKSVQKATTMVFELLTGRVGEAFGVSMLLDIATQHHLFIIGHGGANINRIMQQTGATIHFPDPVTTEPQRRGTVCITGTMSSVFLARHQLLGCLPLVLMFDLKEDIEVDQGLLSQLMEQLDVFISIKPKPKQTAKSVIVKTIESNTRNVYEARRRILGLSQETPTFEMGFDVASSHSESLSDYQSRNKDMSSCFGLMTGIKNLQPFETHPTTIASSPLKNTGYGQMMMFANQHPKCHQSTPVYPPPFCYIPPCGFPDWRLYSPSHHHHRLHPTQMQHTLIPASFPAVPSQRSSALNDNEDLGLQMGGSLSVPQMAPLSPSLAGVSSHNLRAVADSIPTLLHPHPSSTLPFTTSPLSLDFISSNAISSLSSEPALNSSQLDLFSNFFYGKSVLRNDTQHSLLRNHLDPTLTGLSCLQENISSGTFSSTPVFPSPRPYTVEAGYSHSSPLYSLQQSTSSASPAAMSSSSSSSAVPYHRPVHQQYAVHDGMFPTMPDKSNDVYPTTLITDSGLVDNSMAPVGYHSVNGSAYALGTKQHIDDERHDLLEDGRQTFPAQDVDLDVDRESDGSSEFGGSNKAPGSNRPKKSITECNLEGGSLLLSDIDYEQMKVLASKAMQKKPVGESRIPTDYWSGLGFSRSMPASAIRERLNLNNSNYDGPKMTAPYEDAEEDSEMWKTTLNSDNRTDDSGSLLDFVSQLSAQCRELSLQQDRRGIGQIDGRHQINSSSSSSSVWQPLSEKRTDGATVCIETDLSLLFGEMGLGKYAELFKQQEIDMQTFLTLTDQDLRDLGISTFGARRKMLLAIADFNKRQSLLPPPPGLSNPFQDAGNVRRHDIVSQSVRW